MRQSLGDLLAELNDDDPVGKGHDGAHDVFDDKDGDALIAQLDVLEERLQAGEHRAVFEHCSSLRHRLPELTGGHAFRAQRLWLYQLDCLLEEMGYLALRHRNFWLGVAVHWSVALSMDLLAIRARGIEVLW